MEHINELRDSLNGYFGWNKARLTCVVNMLLSVIVARNSEFKSISLHHFRQGDAIIVLSTATEIFKLNYTEIAGFIFQLFFVWRLLVFNRNSHGLAMGKSKYQYINVRNSA